LSWLAGVVVVVALLMRLDAVAAVRVVY